MDFQTKDEFFEAFQGTGRIDRVDLAGGRRVFVREMSSHERTQYELSLNTHGGGLDTCRERLVVMTACRENGELLFDEKDLPRVGRMPSSILDPIVKVAQTLNGLGTQTSTEDIRKN